MEALGGISAVLPKDKVKLEDQWVKELIQRLRMLIED